MAVGNILNLAGPPRNVPLLVRLRILFGGFLNQFGWFFFGFGLIFVWIFSLNADLTSWYSFRGQLETAEGVVLKSERTSFSSGGSRHHEGTPVYANYYSFGGPGEVEYKGVSYKTGQELKKGQKVTVEYPQGKPEISRIRGMRRSPIGLFGLFPIIFPLLGLCFVIAGVKKGIKANRLLTVGEQTTGRLKSKIRTNTKVNNQYVYKLTFEFSTPEGANYEAVAKTHEPQKLEDEAEEPLLYDPMLPSYAVMLDALPGSPRIDENGNIRAGSVCTAFLCLVIPAVTIVGHVSYICLKFFAD